MQMGCPLAGVAMDSSPRSISVSCPIGGNGWTGALAQEIATYQPSAWREIVTGLGVPSNGRDQSHRNAPNLGEDQEAVIKPCAVAILFVGGGSGPCPCSARSSPSHPEAHAGRTPDRSSPKRANTSCRM